MLDRGKIVFTADALLCCTPGLSTIACSAQLIYLALRVNEVANPVQGFSIEIKLQVLNKEKSDLYWGLFPVVGNLYLFAKLIIYGFKDQLKYAIRCSNKEVVQLCVANNYLDDSVKSLDIVKEASSSSAEIMEELIGGLGASSLSANKALADTLFIHYQTQFNCNTPIQNQTVINYVIARMENFIAAENLSEAEKLAKTLPLYNYYDAAATASVGLVKGFFLLLNNRITEPWLFKLIFLKYKDDLSKENKEKLLSEENLSKLLSNVSISKLDERDLRLKKKETLRCFLRQFKNTLSSTDLIPRIYKRILVLEGKKEVFEAHLANTSLQKDSASSVIFEIFPQFNLLKDDP